MSPARLLVLLTALGTAVPDRGAAQDTTRLPEGTSVRVITRSGNVILGTARGAGQAGATPGSLVVRPAGDSADVVLLLDTLARVERRLTRPEQDYAFRRGFGIGLGVGLVGGFLIGAMMPVEPDCQDQQLGCIDLSGLDRAGNSLGGMLVGGLAGMIVGAMMGRSSAENGWRPVPLPLRVSLQAADGGRLTRVSVGLPLPAR